MPKIDVLTPTASAIVRMIPAANAGAAASVRSAVTEIVHGSFDHAHQPRVAHVVFHPGHRSERLERRASRMHRRQPAPGLLGRQHVQMELQLEIELPLAAVPLAGWCADACGAGGSCQACDRTCATAPAIRCQFCSSAASCFLPVLVS